MKNVCKGGRRNRLNRLKIGEVQSVLAYAASLMLTGVPPVVCESVLSEFYCSVKRSLTTIMS